MSSPALFSIALYLLLLLLLSCMRCSYIFGNEALFGLITCEYFLSAGLAYFMTESVYF